MGEAGAMGSMEPSSHTLLLNQLVASVVTSMRFNAKFAVRYYVSRGTPWVR